MGHFKLHWWLDPTPRDSDSLGLGGSLGIQIYKTTPGHFNVQPRWNWWLRDRAIGTRRRWGQRHRVCTGWPRPCLFAFCSVRSSLSWGLPTTQAWLCPQRLVAASISQSQTPYSEFSWIMFTQPPRRNSDSFSQITKWSPSSFKELSLSDSMISKPCPSAEGIRSLRRTRTLISVSALLASYSVWDLLPAPCTCWGTSASWERGGKGGNFVTKSYGRSQDQFSFLRNPITLWVERSGIQPGLWAPLGVWPCASPFLLPGLCFPHR